MKEWHRTKGSPAWHTWPTVRNKEGWDLRKIPVSIQKELLLKYEGSKRLRTYRQLKHDYEYFKSLDRQIAA